MASEDRVLHQRRLRYDGEDTSPTTQRERMGWYSYGVAAEVFAVCGVGKRQSSIFLYYSTSEIYDRIIPPSDTRAISTRKRSVILR
jgi:hypothetical protein